MAPADTAQQDLQELQAPAPHEVLVESELLAADAMPAPSDDADDPPQQDAVGQPGALGDPNGAPPAENATTDQTGDEGSASSAEQAAALDQPVPKDQTSDHNAVVAATTEQPAPAMGKIEGGWGYVYAAYGVTWTCLALYVAYLVIYRRMQSSGGNS